MNLRVEHIIALVLGLAWSIVSWADGSQDMLLSITARGFHGLASDPLPMAGIGVRVTSADEPRSTTDVRCESATNTAGQARCQVRYCDPKEMLNVAYIIELDSKRDYSSESSVRVEVSRCKIVEPLEKVVNYTHYAVDAITHSKKRLMKLSETSVALGSFQFTDLPKAEKLAEPLTQELRSSRGDDVYASLIDATKNLSASYHGVKSALPPGSPQYKEAEKLASQYQAYSVLAANAGLQHVAATVAKVYPAFTADDVAQLNVQWRLTGGLADFQANVRALSAIKERVAQGAGSENKKVRIIADRFDVISASRQLNANEFSAVVDMVGVARELDKQF